jgi:hypothetical protein
MLDLQSALNVGDGFFYESEQWMEDEIQVKRKELHQRLDLPVYALEPGRREACVIDPLLGTSVKLLSVMVSSPETHKDTFVNAYDRPKQRDYFNFPEIRLLSASIRLRKYYHEEP